MMIAPDITDLSPNFNKHLNDVPVAMPATVRTVIIHSTRSGKSMNPSEMEGTLNYMRQPGTVSSHWVIARDGTKARVVPDDRQAWHAGADNDNAWGIELEQGIEADGFTEPQLLSLIQVCRGYIGDFGVLPVHARWSIEPGFIGHSETSQGQGFGKSDPGVHFPWAEFIAALEEAPMPEPTQDEMIIALVTLGHFIRSRWNLADLSDADKAAIRAAADKVANAGSTGDQA